MRDPVGKNFGFPRACSGNDQECGSAVCDSRYLLSIESLEQI
jgi:hypothetical protein